MSDAASKSVRPSVSNNHGVYPAEGEESESELFGERQESAEDKVVERKDDEVVRSDESPAETGGGDLSTEGRSFLTHPGGPTTQEFVEHEANGHVQCRS